MSSQIGTGLNSTGLRALDLSSINCLIPNKLGETTQFVDETAREKAEEEDLKTPKIRRSTPDPITVQLSDSRSTLRNLICNIYQHSRGSSEDVVFFKSHFIPQEHDDSQINLIFQHCRQIRDKGINPEIFSLLRDLTEKISLKYGISLNSESPLSLSTTSDSSSSDRTSNDTSPILARAQSLDPKTDQRDLKTS